MRSQGAVVVSPLASKAGRSAWIRARLYRSVVLLLSVFQIRFSGLCAWYATLWSGSAAFEAVLNFRVAHASGFEAWVFRSWLTFL
jgi:hypothetical protein